MKKQKYILKDVESGSFDDVTTDDFYLLVDETVSGGGGDMSASTYDPASKAEQVLTISDILDEDDMSSDSANKAPSQQSVKAFIEANYRPLYDRLITKLDVTGTYVFDLLSGETWRLTMVGNTTFSIGTKPPANFTKTVTVQMDGNFAPTWSAELSDFKTGSYHGTKLNTLVIEYVDGTMTKLQITQND